MLCCLWFIIVGDTLNVDDVVMGLTALSIGGSSIDLLNSAIVARHGMVFLIQFGTLI